MKADRKTLEEVFRTLNVREPLKIPMQSLSQEVFSEEDKHALLEIEEILDQPLDFF